MLPSLRSDGTLPPGVHDASLPELLAAYPARNEQRRLLNDALTRVAKQLWQLDRDAVILVDGSFVTDKTDPNDVDLLIITSRYNELTLQQHLDRSCPVEAVSIHLYAEPHMPNTLLTFFTTSRSGREKGIIRLLRL